MEYSRCESCNTVVGIQGAADEKIQRSSLVTLVQNCPEEQGFSAGAQ